MFVSRLATVATLDPALTRGSFLWHWGTPQKRSRHLVWRLLFSKCYWLLAVAGGPHRTEAITTVDGLLTIGPEGNHRVPPTLSTNRWMHFSS
jgi:hypothetical protein